jgi:hypothetical protein
LQGQTLSFNLAFSDSVTLLPGRYASDFDLGVVFQSNRHGFVGFATGTGYLVDAAGNPLCDPRPLGSASSGAGWMSVGLFPFFIDKNGTVDPSLSTPLTFYGAHFNITLPDSPYSITGGEVDFFAQQTRYANGFRIGPHVPEEGSTLSLLGFAVIALGITKRPPEATESCAMLVSTSDHRAPECCA